jgi:hypothetical protein
VMGFCAAVSRSPQRCRKITFTACSSIPSARVPQAHSC